MAFKNTKPFAVVVDGVIVEPERPAKADKKKAAAQADEPSIEGDD